MPYSGTLAQSISCSRQPQMRSGYIWSNGVVYNTKYILHNALYLLGLSVVKLSLPLKNRNGKIHPWLILEKCES